MKLKKIRLVNFKRFDDLTIDLGEQPKKVIALVGPNGCGKSSVFDGLLAKNHAHAGQIGFDQRGINGQYYSKYNDAGYVDNYYNHI